VLTNVLIVGGRAEDRLKTAYDLHRGGALRSGPFVHLDARHDQDVLRAALQARVVSIEATPCSDPIRDSERGMLFVDSIESLPLDAQRMMLGFLRRNTDVSLEESEGSWWGRLAVGNVESLAAAVREGRFLAALHDALDKIRVHLPMPVQGVA
jgi:DNA-binding NtrC family response regulator